MSDKVHVTAGDWLEGLSALLHGRDWDGPWSRAARARNKASRQRGAALQAELVAMGAAVSLEMCRDAADNGWADALRDTVSRDLASSVLSDYPAAAGLSLLG